MRNDFETVLDECLGRLKAGDSVDACLERYPEYAEELKPLLETAQHVEPLSFTEPPRSEALAKGRQRFLSEATRLHKQQRTSDEVEPSLLQRIQDFFGAGMGVPVLGRAAAAVVILLLLFGILGRVAVQASETSLPGDPLYPVKQVTRQVQLVTTLNREAREEKAKQIRAEERQEVQQATEQGRVFEEDVAGAIVDWRTDAIVMEGDMVVQVTETTRIQGEPEVGRFATVHVRSEDGNLVAEQIVVEQQAVMAPTDTAQPTPTFTLEPTKVPPTDTPQPTKVPPTPVPTETPTAKPKVTETPTVAATADTEPSLDIYELRGTIDDISEDGTIWVVAGQAIQVTMDTIITGEPAVGRIARVLANRLEDGTFVAREIEVEKVPTPTPQKVFLSGVLASPEGENIWYVAGQRIRKDDRTIIEGGELKAGAFVDVEGLQESSTTVFAEKITVVRRCENPVPLEGAIVSADARLWVIDVNGTQISVGIDGDTEIVNAPVRGAHAQLETCRVGDAYIAQRIYVMSTPTPTNTPMPTNTPVVTPTSESSTSQSTPTVEPESTPTSQMSPTPEPTSTPEPTATPTPTVDESAPSETVAPPKEATPAPTVTVAS